MKQDASQECYSKNKRTLSDAPQYAECVQEKLKDIVSYEQKAKHRLIFMQLLQQKNKDEFKLANEIGKFIQEFGINVDEMKSLISWPPQIYITQHIIINKK